MVKTFLLENGQAVTDVITLQPLRAGQAGFLITSSGKFRVKAVTAPNRVRHEMYDFEASAEVERLN